MAVKPKLPSKMGAVNDGQLRNQPSEPFGDPMYMVRPPIEGMGGTKNDIGEMSGFLTDGYIDKKGMVYGEAAKLNYLPPGMDITKQENADIRDMSMKSVTAGSYPGDGWE